MDDDEDFLAAVEADNKGTPVTDEPTPEPPVAEEPAKPEVAAEPPATPPAAEPVLELTPEQAIPPVPKPEETSTAPIAALLDERDRRKAAEAELERLRAAQQPAQVPDAYEDPEGFAAYQQAQIGQALQNVTLNTSERFARKEHGAETVETAKAWALQRFGTDPLYRQQILNDPDPYERVVTDWRREQVFAEVQDPNEFKQFKAWKQAQNALQAQPGGQPLSPTPQTPAIPAPSLASAPSAGSILTEPIQSDDEVFEEVMPRKR